MSALRGALGQIRSTPDPAANLDLVRAAARQAATAGASMVVFPEATMASFGSRLPEVAEPLDGPFADGVRSLAGETGLLVVAGMFEPAPDGRVFNTLLITDGATIDTHYRKRHLFDAFRTRESDTVAPGSEPVVVDALGTRIGFATCYDVRFAAQFTELGRLGAEVICLPASWADGPGKLEQWKLLVRARAMDSQAYLLAAGQALVDTGGRKALGVGHSLVADPLGEVVLELGDQPEVAAADLDLARVATVRETVPILR